jgi:predicted DNA-binding ribbon-helix-helix protein
VVKSQVIKRSIVIDGRKTSVSIEEPFWQALKEIARERAVKVSTLVASIKVGQGENSNLSSAIRVFILSHVRAKVPDREGQLGSSAMSRRSA